MADQSLVLKVNARVMRSRGGNDEPLEEVFITADEPFVNFRFNLEGDYVGRLPAGSYEIHFKRPAEPMTGKITEPGSPRSDKGSS